MSKKVEFICPFCGKTFMGKKNGPPMKSCHLNLIKKKKKRKIIEVSMGLSPKERKRIKKEMKKIVGGP
jgi:transposase-like protein